MAPAGTGENLASRLGRILSKYGGIRLIYAGISLDAGISLKDARPGEQP
jgi:hypothetical protein